MHYERVHIDAFGSALAPVVVTSEELEERLADVYRALHIAPGQLEALTGVRERRWWQPRKVLADGATMAARDALERSAVAAQDLEVLVYAGVCRDQIEPATACRVAAHLGVSPRAAVYDISNACLGVLNGILDIAHRIELGHIRAGMVVTCESAREIVDVVVERLRREPDMALFTKCLATLTGGSGAAAVVVADRSVRGDGRRRLIAGVHETAPEHHDLCRWGHRPVGDPAEGRREEYMITDAAAVLRHGVELGVRTWRHLLAELGWGAADVDRTICHQVGGAHRETILERIGVPAERDFATFPFLGNIGTVSLPMTAALAERRGVLQAGQRVAFLGIGSGLNCLMQGYEW